MKTYEMTGNVHMQTLKCTFPRGTRIAIDSEGGTILVKGEKHPIPPEVELLIRHDLLRELTEEEASQPEVVQEFVQNSPRRAPMRVVMEEEVSKVVSRIGEATADTAEAGSDEGNARTIRGMKVYEKNESSIDEVKQSGAQKIDNLARAREAARAKREVQKKASREEQEA